MDEKNITEFKLACKNYFSTIRLSALSCYGRFLQLRAPTAMKKADLIESIIGVLCGEITPERNNRGAPIKGDHIDESIFATVEHFKKLYLYQNASTCNDINHELDLNPIDNQAKGIISSTDTEKASTSLQCTVQFSKLKKEQKRLFMAFLESL